MSAASHRPDDSVSQPAEAGNVLSVSGTLDANFDYTELWMPDGQVLRLPTALLLENHSHPAKSHNSLDVSDESQVIPVIEESLSVTKRLVETGKIRLSKTVEEYQKTLNEPLAVRTFDVERVILNRVVETTPETREEGNTTVYPVIEEQLVLTKQLVLKEEIRITKRDTERVDNQVVTLRREHVVVEQISSDGKRQVAPASPRPAGDMNS